MKTTTILATASLALLAVMAPHRARAGILDGLGTWEGSGSTHALGGADQGTFAVSVTRTAAGASKVRSDGRVTLSNGQVITFWQEMEDHGSGGFSLRTNSGAGGGQCFANGMCTSYEDRGDGHAFATTFVRDTPERVRMLITELDKGQAVRFMEETLTKRQ